MLLSLVVPSYNEEKNVPLFYETVRNTFEGKIENYEVIFVDDGSTDGTYREIKELHKRYDNVRAVSFSRNFGKEAAIYAGLGASHGDLVCLIDADLQQHPRVVLEMLEEMRDDESVDCVAAYQKKRIEGKLMSFAKNTYYKLINRLSDVNYVGSASDFRLMKRQMVDAILSLSESQRFSKGIFSFVGFHTKYIPYIAEQRASGSTKFPLRKLLKYASNGLTAFSTAPLKFSAYLGVLSAIASIVYFIVLVVMKFGMGMSVPSYGIPAVLLFFLGGVQLFCLGILGSYIAKMHVELKHRPIYIARARLDYSNEDTAEEKASDEAVQTSGAEK